MFRRSNNSGDIKNILSKNPSLYPKIKVKSIPLSTFYLVYFELTLRIIFCSLSSTDKQCPHLLFHVQLMMIMNCFYYISSLDFLTLQSVSLESSANLKQTKFILSPPASFVFVNDIWTTHHLSAS